MTGEDPQPLNTTIRDSAISAETEPRMDVARIKAQNLEFSLYENSAGPLMHGPAPIGLIGQAAHAMRETRAHRPSASEVCPTDRIDPDHEAYAVLRVRADHLAETGELERASGVYQELLGKLMAYGPDPNNDFRDATKLSSLYQALASVDRRLGHAAEAEVLTSRRIDLWRRWNGKLPNNPFVLGQLAIEAR